jgi:hypothetical protein
MKVLHVIPSVSAVYGEPSDLVVDIERAPAERGIEVTLLLVHVHALFSFARLQHLSLHGRRARHMSCGRLACWNDGTSSLAKAAFLRAHRATTNRIGKCNSFSKEGRLGEAEAWD